MVDDVSLLLCKLTHMLADLSAHKIFTNQHYVLDKNELI